MKNYYKTLKIATLLMLFSGAMFAQKFQGIGTEKPNPRAILHMVVEDPANFQQGFMPPQLTTAQRTNVAFTTAITSITTLTGLTVYDTNLLAYFVWNGTTWQQLATNVGALNISGTGLGGLNPITTSGLSFSIDGSNLVKVNQLVTGDIQGNYTNGFTVSGLSNKSIIGSPTAINSILSFNGTNFQYVPAPTSQTTSIAGLGGITVTGSDLVGFSIAGQNLTAGSNVTIAGGVISTQAPTPVTSIVGVNNITVNGTGLTGFTVTGPNITTQITSITGGSGITVLGTDLLGYTVNGQNLTAGSNVTIAGGVISTQAPTPVTSIVGVNNITVNGSGSLGFTVTGPSFSSTSVVGVSGLTVLGTGSSLSVSGAGMVVLQQSLVNAVGSASTVAFGGGLTPVFKALVRLPSGIKNISASLNVYTLGINSASYRVEIGSVATFADLTAVSSTSVDNFQNTSTDINVSGFAGTVVLVKVYANVASAGEAAYLQGITLTIKD